MDRTNGFVRSIRTVVAFALLTVAAAGFAAELPRGAPEDVGMSTSGLARVGEVMRRHIEAGDIQGAVTAIARRGKVVHFEAHGLMDVEADKPMADDAMFIMMSSTKPVLGVAALIAMEEGLFRATDPVSRYIPEFADMQVAVLKEPMDEDVSPWGVRRENVPEHRVVAAARDISIHDLLTHTSGLRSGGLGSAVDPVDRRRWTGNTTLAEYIPALGKALLDFQPGSRWTYSPGTGLDVVARIIEVVTDTPYDQFVQERVFDPLDMVDTHYNVPAEKENRRVEIKDRDMSRFRGRTTTYFSGSAGLTSTARDYLRFEQMLLNGGTLDGNRVLSPHSVKLMGSNHLGDLYKGFSQSDRGVGYGYTVSVILDPVTAGSSRSAGAFGWGGAFGTRSWTDPAEELVGVIMLQQPHGRTQANYENAVRHAIID